MATPEQALELAGELTERAVIHRAIAFELRAGDMSNWEIDLKYGLGFSHILSRVGRYMVERADVEGFSYEVLSGIGIGQEVVSAVSVALTELGRAGDFVTSYAVEKHEDDSRPSYAYGPHAPVEGKKIWALGATANTGDSLVTLNNLMKEFDATVECASVVVDRSNGRVADRLGELGIKFDSLFEFSEETGLLTPTPQTTPESVVS